MTSSMSPINVSDPRTLSEIESAILEINSKPGAPLQMQTESAGKRRGALHDVSRLQMLVTWARHAKDQPICFHSAANPETALNDLGDYAPGVAAVRLSKGVRVGSLEFSRRDVLERAADRVKRADNGDYDSLNKGRIVDLICVSGSRIQYLRPLFTSRSSASVKDKYAMARVIRKLVNVVAVGDGEHIEDELVNSCAVFCEELFLNTQEHAASDLKGNPYVEHVEGLIAGWTQVIEAQYQNDFFGHPRLRQFWEHDLIESGKFEPRRSLRCLQLSFFDTGPGLVARFTGRPHMDMALEEERVALMRCLEKHATSKTAHGTGLGLPSVLEELRRVGGLIRIRSGRHSIFNAFLPKDDSVGLYAFQDWSDQELGCVEGAAISILIPIRRPKWP